MPRLQPIIWSKGTSLTQQHLQMQDQFLESSLHFRLNALQFRPWGFHALQIDREALAAGTFLLNTASGIFPDGLLFDIPRSDAAPPPKPLVDCFDADQNELDVYFAIPPWRDGGLNVAAPRVGADTRYTPQVTMLRDENTGLSEKPVLIARKNFRFLTQSELQQGTVSMRVARVKRSAAGVCSLDATFVPPLLDFHVERLPGHHRAAPVGNAVCPQHAAIRNAAAKEPEPGRIFRLRYRGFLAALYGQLVRAVDQSSL